MPISPNKVALNSGMLSLFETDELNMIPSTIHDTVGKVFPWVMISNL